MVINEDELKRLTNRCIAKLLTNLGEDINLLQKKEIKSQIRLLENNIRSNIFNVGHYERKNTI